MEMPGKDSNNRQRFFGGDTFVLNYCNAICEKKANCPNDIFKKVFRYVTGIMHFYFWKNYYEFKRGGIYEKQTCAKQKKI